MKNLLGAVVMIMLAIGTPWLAWRDYGDIATLYEHGEDGTLSVLAETGSSLKRSGRRKYHYQASIQGTPVQLTTSSALKPGGEYPVIFSRERLRSYASQSAGAFTAYRFGRKSESKGDIFLREVGTGFLFVLVGLEIIWIVSAGFFLKSFTMEQRATRTPTQRRGVVG